MFLEAARIHELKISFHIEPYEGWLFKHSLIFKIIRVYNQLTKQGEHLKISAKTLSTS
jgi:hypothetical protein